MAWIKSLVQAPVRSASRWVSGGHAAIRSPGCPCSCGGDVFGEQFADRRVPCRAMIRLNVSRALAAMRTLLSGLPDVSRLLVSPVNVQHPVVSQRAKVVLCGGRVGEIAVGR